MGGTFDGTDLRVYLNGTQSGINAYTGDIDNGVGDTKIGRLFCCNYDFEDEIGLVTVWDVVLSPNEIGALWRGTHPFPFRNDNIMLLSPIEGNNSPEPDWSGNGNIGTVTNTTRATSGFPTELLENYLS